MTELIGESVFVQTLTNYFTGKIEEVGEKYLRLSSAAWIADTGRLSDFLTSGKANEVEPFVSDVYVILANITDVTAFNHPLPSKVQ